MFAAVASGIACGVFGYGIAIIGTLGFCGAAVVLYYSPFGKPGILTGCCDSILTAMPKIMLIWKES